MGDGKKLQPRQLDVKLVSGRELVLDRDGEEERVMRKIEEVYIRGNEGGIPLSVGVDVVLLCNRNFGDCWKVKVR